MFAGMSGDELLSELERIERERAALVARSVVLMEVMARGRRREALAALAPDVPAGRRTLEVAEADACVVDEVALATGLRVHECRARLDLACGDASRTGPIRAALGRGELSWERARRVMDSAAQVPAEHIEDLVTRVVAPYPARSVDGVGGLLVPHEVFGARLRRFVARHVDASERHAQRMRQRCTRIDVLPEGEATLSASGHVLRVASAHERVDRIARRLRGEGDPRTLAQLRSDITLDLLQWGELPTDSAILDVAGLSAYSRFAGALPAARVDVVISAASLMGASADPGMVPIAGRQEWICAEIVRDVAFAAGSTWRRLVTDPMSGHLVDLSSTGYAVTGDLRERIVARDRVSRVPGSTRPAGACDMDHDIDYADGGPTSESNVSAKHRGGHNHKTHRTWHSHREPAPDGTIIWTTPTGRRYRTTPWDYRDPDPPTPDQILEALSTAGHPAADPAPGALTAFGSRPAQPERVVHRITRCPDCRRTTTIDTVLVGDLTDDPIHIHRPRRTRLRRTTEPRRDPWTDTDPGPPPF
ncbi:hypothetical protein GCM10025883_45410 [Mobilicoccus caccae]|uniref:DUF222 domain-containing protein n=3 Tax=Mobilicoccus caccae TaxID=1859295 RepID=A0ABQ6IZJ2_9MICO|nr:hypothetical protein GCM10025883_43930 [Mobilicoccus caccae]GMA42496.1 hypothetical protein GCM10025883_45410 [Mobilicoccus caccae]